MFAVTERLLLRPGWPEEAAALAAAIGDRQVARMLARVPHPYTIDDAAAWLTLPDEATRPRFLIVRRTGGAIIGGIGIHGAPAELGYWLARDAWGEGLATEAARAVVALADDTLRLPRLVASHAIDNPASARVLAKVGFRPDGPERTMVSLGRGGPVPVRPLARERPQAGTFALAA